MGKYFGTDGVRGVANVKLTAKMAYRIGRFIGQYPNGKKNKILIGRDTRLSGSMLCAALMAGIAASGSDAFELGITTTPSISYLVETNDFDFGVMISASHNPFKDNGIKIFAPSGEKLSNDIELLIEKYMDSHHDDLPKNGNDGVGQIFNSSFLLENYLDYLASKALTSLEGLKVAIDCAHGSSSVTAKRLFVDRLHLDCEIFNDDFDGTNINSQCGSTHIEFLTNLMKSGKYDVGFAFDGDADRLIVVDNNGNVVDGDSQMLISARYLRKQNKLADNKVVITVMSNFGLKKVFEKDGFGYEEVQVGDKYVQACLKEKHLSLGGEQSGHVIFYDELNTGDGMLSGIHCLNVIAAEKKPLCELTKDFVSYPQTLKNIPVLDKETILCNQGLLDRIQELTIKLNGNGRILVRPSGTEQLIRVMAEAKTQEECDAIVNDLVQYIEAI